MDKKYSYVTLLTNDSYVYGVVLLVESMKKVNTKYPLHVLIIDEVSAANREILDQLGVSYEVVDVIPTPEAIYEHNMAINPNTASTWINCWTKLRIFDLEQFDKIVFLDADIMIMKNLDHLFDMPNMTSALDGEYFNIWPIPHFNAGCIVIEPSKYIFNQILKFANELTVNDLPKDRDDMLIIADQEILNMYFDDWAKKPELHLNKYYDIFAPYIQEEQVEDVKENCYFIHYVGRKPWTFWLKNPAETYSEFFYEEGKKLIEEKVKDLDWDKIHDKIVLTVYAICKNEKNNIEKWLKCFSKADYVCVLDTGSTDGTWEYLQEARTQYANLIIDQKIISPWRFDTARNESLKLVPPQTTMYFMVDLDEIIKEDGWEKEVANSWTPIFDRGMYTYNRDVQEDDVVTKCIPEYRIHSKDWYKYINIVHEALINKAGRKQLFIETCTKIPITVWHYNQKGQTNYMELCEKDLEEYPDDWVMRLQLAIEYEIRSEEDKALKHFFYIIQNENTLQSFELGRCYFGIGRIYSMRENYNAALLFFTEGRIHAPDFTDNYIAAAEIYYNSKQYLQAAELCKAAFKYTNTAYWCSVYDIKSYYSYWLLGLCNYFLGKKLKAIGLIEIAYQLNPDEKFNDLIKDIMTQLIQEKIMEE